MFKFKITSKKEKARRGIFSTPHGDIETPVFMPVGTVGAVKSVAPWELKELGAQIVLGNTYHLMLRPGEKLIKKAGGLQRWTQWNGPMLTDSGGYQVFSLGGRLSSNNIKKDKEEGSRVKLTPAKITDRGVEFRSHIDGTKHFLDAEKSIKIQQDIGADIIMAFDECPPGDADINYIKTAVDRTHKWLDESISAWTNRETQALFGIVQGGTNKELRELSAKFINSKDLPGSAIGGVSVGESRDSVWKAVEWSVPNLDENKPRYLMGVGEPADIINAVNRGCDMFDCVLPTRLARHGVVWISTPNARENTKVSRERNTNIMNRKDSERESSPIKKAEMPDGSTFAYTNIDLKKGRFRQDMAPIDKNCTCPACQSGFSRSYISHLIKENEILGIRLTTLHNLHFIFDLMGRIKRSID